jgi:GDP-4-dehydro-6-deoxy-D-mannose reductase
MTGRPSTRTGWYRRVVGRVVSVTGADGFVGRHLLDELGPEAVPVRADVRDLSRLVAELATERPRAVVHLAAASSVAASLEEPTRAWEVNVLGTVNLLEAVRTTVPGARVLVISSGEVYGEADQKPTPEAAPLRPRSPYAASKVAAEVACEHACRMQGLDVVLARSFPHLGPGQEERFAIGSWVRQIARLEAEGGGVIRVGDVSVERDFTDVRDVCRAYELLLDAAVPPGTYNVASGKRVRLAHVLELLVGMAEVSIEIEQDPSLLRPVDLAVLHGDPGRLASATGWRPEIPLERTLADALDAARSEVRAA